MFTPIKLLKRWINQVAPWGPINPIVSYHDEILTIAKEARRMSSDALAVGNFRRAFKAKKLATACDATLAHLDGAPAFVLEAREKLEELK